MAVAGAVQLADLVRRIGLQEHQIGQHQHRHAAIPAEEHAVGDEGRALVVVLRQFRHECGTRHFIERDEGARDDRDHDKIGEQRALAPVRWIPEQQIAYRHGQRCRIHQRMPASPARAQIVRDLPHERIDERVKHQRDGDRRADKLGRQMNDLVVEG